MNPLLVKTDLLFVNTLLAEVDLLVVSQYQSGSFSLINVGRGFHCLRSLSFYLVVNPMSEPYKLKLRCKMPMVMSLRAS